MVHVSQKIRAENLQLVKKLIAQSMRKGKGAKHRPLLAVLCTTYGFHKRTANEYLETLQEAGQILFDPDMKLWMLPQTKKKK